MTISARVKEWRKRRAEHIDAKAAADPLVQWWCAGGLPPVDKKRVPNRRRRKVSAA